MNTQFEDLKNQMKFIGIEHVDAYYESVVTLKSSGYTKHFWKAKMLLGTMMMRHVHTQKYRGTSTTLMSLPAKVRFVRGRIFFADIV